MTTAVLSKHYTEYLPQQPDMELVIDAFTFTDEISPERLNDDKFTVQTLQKQKEFEDLVRKWEVHRPRGADISRMVMEESYQRIIGMGRDAVPFLLQELEHKPGHWFWALYAITGINPVPPEHEGDLKEMAKAWINWGKQQGYSW